MISKIRIKNFKSHSDTQLEFGNLTILTGMNGCGKTSLIQALLLLRQTFQKNRLQEGLDLNRPLCSIGVADDALFKLAKDSVIDLDLEMDRDKNLEFSFDAGNDLKDSFIKKRTYNGNAANPAVLGKLSLFNDEFQYVSARRWGGRSDFPKETYAVEIQKQISQDEGQGELVAHYLYKYGSEDVTDYYDEPHEDKSLLQQTVYWEQKVSPRVTINVEQGQDSNSFNVIYGFAGDDVQSKPIRGLRAENIGFGISYTLPVIVALLSANPGALVIIENPEAHLHPEGQAEMARLLAKVAAKGVQVVVETHSDHIINGVQIACKRNAKDPAEGLERDVLRMYYFRNDEKQTTQVERIEVKEDGVLVYQPKGFFDRMETDMASLYFE